MKTTTYQKKIRSSILLLSLLAACGASAGQSNLATSVHDARVEVVQTRNELQATVAAIDALTKQKTGDMQPTYKVFVAQIGKTESALSSTQKRVKTMAAEADTHFGSWQAEIDGISNPDLKKKAQKRLESVKKSYGKVISKLKEAGTKFEKLLSDLNDIQKTLANDLTPGGVKSVDSTVGDARWNLKFVRSAINDAIEELTDMEKSLGTTASK